MSAEEVTPPASSRGYMAPGVPESCPPWCHGGRAGHQQAADEGCTPEAARLHSSGDTVGKSIVGGTHHSWNLELFADPRDTGWWGEQYLELDTRSVRPGEPGTFNDGALRVHPSEARSLARQLLHFADMAELS